MRAAICEDRCDFDDLAPGEAPEPEMIPDGV